jgi:PAS domain S-box-containing protein
MHFTYVSPQCEAVTGHAAEDVMADVRLFARSLHPDDLEAVVAEVVRSSGEMDRFDAVFRLIAPDGHVTWLHATADPVSVEGDLRWRGVAMDVSVRMAAEVALRTAEERYRAVVQNTYDLVTLADPAGAIVYASPSHRAVLGLDPNELVGRDVLERYGPADVESARAGFAEALQGVRGSPVRFTLRGRDDREVALEGTGWQPVFDDEGTVKLVLGIARDVTSQVRSERERAELVAGIVEAQEQERARIAHDLHDDPVQAMTAVGLHIAALANGVEDPRVRARLGDVGLAVEEAVARLRNLMFQLWPPALETGGLAKALEDYLFHEFGEGFAYEVRSSVEPEPPVPLRIVAYRVVQEALQNVRKHAQASRVLVLLVGGADQLSVRVEDDGVGFDPGASQDPRHVGLRSMRQRVELAGGTFGIESSPGSGSIAWFKLPIR